ncbi:MAG: sulfotransferase [Novosphingobium sp.]
MPRTELDADAICEKVERETELGDFGCEWFRQPLELLIEALHEEASLSPLGLFGAIGQLEKVLRDRLWTQHWLSEHPEIEQRALHRPIFVVGPMRSGTTRLHRLLAADERFSHLRFFETISPTPRPEFRHDEIDKRRAYARRLLALVHSLNPNTAVIHPTGPLEPEEELGLLVASMWGMKHEAQWHVPTYGRWAEGQDAAPAYEHMARLLKLVGWARGEDDLRPWVLKTPQHMLDLPALLRVFPDARIIFTHREPQAVVGSSCSLVWNQMIIHSNRVDAQGIGREWLRKTALQIERMQQARERLPEAQRIDVHFEEMDRDWKSVMKRIYAFLDMDIAPALPTMSRYLRRAERKRTRHPHRYSLPAFGLDANEVGERFERYRRDFDLVPPSAAAAVQKGARTLLEVQTPAYVRALGDWEHPKAPIVSASRATARR